jgi:hypothetical protein
MSRAAVSDATNRENAANPDKRQSGCQQGGAGWEDYCSKRINVKSSSEEHCGV